MDITVKEVSDDAGNAAVGLRVRNFAYEINVVLGYEEIEQLADLSAWEPGAVQIGSVAGVAAFWSNDNGNIAISVGTNHETWDFCIWLDDVDLQEIVDQTEQLSRANS